MKNKWIKFLLVFCLIFAADFVLYELQPPDPFYRLFPELRLPRRSFFSNPDAVIGTIFTDLMIIAQLVILTHINKTNFLNLPEKTTTRAGVFFGWIDRIVFIGIFLLGLLDIFLSRRVNASPHLPLQIFLVTVLFGFFLTLLWLGAVVMRRFWKQLASLPFLPTNFWGGVWRLLFLLVSFYCVILNMPYF
jgi:hypothetical protein